jgi:hypothetical protein
MDVVQLQSKPDAITQLHGGAHCEMDMATNEHNPTAIVADEVRRQARHRAVHLASRTGDGAMKIARRQFLHLASGAAALLPGSRSVRAQSYPSRPVRIVIGFAAGGPNDILARLIGQWLSERLGQQFVIENRPGAGSNIAEIALRAYGCNEPV